ncbi:MAG: hypothetical protein ACK5NT_11820 [Pyrinomonadaceae bacterium]
MKKLVLSIVMAFCAFAITANAQDTEIKISLHEQFFDALLDAVFTNLEAPSVAISSNTSAACNQTIRLKRQIDGIKTAVKFREGKIYAPLAFEGNYSVPLIGCVDFSGWAETNITLGLDSRKNAIVGRAQVLRVNLSGANGLGGDVLARYVQNSIDEKVNPIEIIGLDKLSFTTPIKDAGKLRMRATGFSHRELNQIIELIIKYRFEKAN